MRSFVAASGGIRLITKRIGDLILRMGRSIMKSRISHLKRESSISGT